MITECYIKMSEALATQVLFVAERASEIICEIVKENADDDGYLWLKSIDNLWIKDDKERVVYIYADKHQVFIGVQDESCEDEDETHECFLSDLNPFDKIEIADYLAERF